MNKKIHVKKGDTVMVISGKDKNKKGKVLVAMPDSGKLIVEGVNMASKHKKPRKQGDTGGIIKQETPLYACKVMYYCDKCKQPVRIGKQVMESGERIRICRKCNDVIDG